MGYTKRRVVVTRRIKIRRPRKTVVTKPVMVRSSYNIPKPEVKHFDFNGSQNALVAGFLTQLSDISQGTGDTQRIGLTTYLRSIFINMNMWLHPSATNLTLRYIFFIDKQGYNTPAVTDLLEPALLSSALAPLSQYNKNYMARFRILQDKMVNMNTAKTDVITIRKYLRLGVKAHYIGASTTFANQVYLCLVGSETNVLQLPTVNFATRITYADN